MRVIYSMGELAGREERSLFLYGPTPRDYDAAKTWRPEALDLLAQINFGGVVYVPEDEGWKLRAGFDKHVQRRWERAATRVTKVGVFWIPRNLELMPGMTSNVEFGGFVPLVDDFTPKPFVLGYPRGTPKMGYLAGVAREEAGMPVRHTLPGTLRAAVKLLDRPSNF